MFDFVKNKYKEYAFVPVFLLLVQLRYLIYYHNKGDKSFDIWDFFVSVYSFFTFYVFIRLVSFVSGKNRKIRVFVNSVLIFFSYVLFEYRANMKNSLDFSIIADNLSEAFSINSLDVIVGAISCRDFVIGGAVIAILLFFERKNRILSWYGRMRHKWYQGTGLLILYMTMVVTPLPTYDEATYFVKTIYDYYSSNSLYASSVSETYPFAKNKGESIEKMASRTNSEELPNIFIIAVESFNSKVIETKSDDGREITPNFNRLIDKGLFVEKFYGNSIQTCKGHIALFSSVIPSIRGKIYKHFPELKNQSVTEILKGVGYDTIFMQAAESLDFDNTGNFTKANGFTTVKSVYEFLSEDDKQNVWGWGPEDGLFYRRFFEFLDRHRNSPESKGPIFATLATVANHMRFNRVPLSKRHFFKDPKNRSEAYANSIYLTDKDFSVFFEQLRQRDYLKNSVVVIVGDHSYPIGDHGIVSSEVAFYEESFRTPFVMLWPGKITPRRITEVAHSQMDIAPTLLELLGIEGVENHYNGVSILATEKVQHPIYLVQPYAGQYLGIVRYPEKYVHHKRTGRGYYFNLEKDPHENNNLIDNISEAKLALFKKDLKFIFLNQMLIETDSLWYK